MCPKLTTILALLTSVTVIFVTVHARTLPCNLPHPPPPPGRDLPTLQPPYLETMSPPPPSMPNPTPPPARELQSPQPPFFYPETRSPPPTSPSPPPARDLPPFFYPEPFPQFQQPPFFYPESRSPLPPYLEKDDSPPMFIQKLIIAAVILAVILLVLILALCMFRKLDLGMIIQAIGLIVAVWTCLSA